MATPGLVERFEAWAPEGSVALVVVVHLGLIVAAPNGLEPVALFTLEATLLGVLIGIEFLAGTPIGETIPLVAAFTGFLAITWGLQRAVESLILASILLVAAIALFVYGVHRYELVLLGLVDDE